MSHSRFIYFIKPNIFTVLLFLAISYNIVPVFSVPSPCYDLASSPTDTTISSVPCIKLTTIPQQFHPMYITRFGFHYQSNAFYSYDLTVKYGSPILNLLFAYVVSCGSVCSIHWLIKHVKRLHMKVAKNYERTL